MITRKSKKTSCDRKGKKPPKQTPTNYGQLKGKRRGGEVMKTIVIYGISVLENKQ